MLRPRSRRARVLGRPRRRYRALRTAGIVLVALTVLFLVAGGWHFSGLIRSDALATRDAGSGTPDMTLTVVSTAPGAVTLRELPGEDTPLAEDSVYGLEWAGGYGQVGGVRGVDGGRVTRDLTVLAGSMPEPGQAAALDLYAFPRRPAQVLGTSVQRVRVAGPLGPLPAWLARGDLGPGAGDTWAILTHGRNGERAETLRAMRTTTAAGMPSMAVSYRNDVGTAPDPSHLNQFGRTEWRDLEAAVRYALGHGARRVLLVGFSQGGAITAAFLERSALADRVSGVMLDAPALDFGAMIDHGAAQTTLPGVGLPVPGALTWTAKRLASLRYGLDWPAVDYLDDSTWLRVPALVFHGTSDDRVPLSISRRLAAQHPDLVRLEVVPGAEHVEEWNVGPRAYDRALRRFVDDLG